MDLLDNLLKINSVLIYISTGEMDETALPIIENSDPETFFEVSCKICEFIIYVY